MSNYVTCRWRLPYAVRVAVVCEAMRNGTGSPSRTAAMFLDKYLARRNAAR